MYKGKGLLKVFGLILLPLLLLMPIMLSTVPVAKAQEEGGGTIVIAFLDDVKTLNPLTYDTVWEDYVISCIYESLVNVEPATLKVIPWLAQKWEMVSRTELNIVDPETGTNYTRVLFRIELAKNMTFSDGVPVNGVAVVFSYRFYMACKGLRNTVDIVTYVNRTWVDKDDPYVVWVELKHDYCSFPYGLSPAILPPHKWGPRFVKNWAQVSKAEEWTNPDATPYQVDPEEVRGFANMDPDFTIGSGPFKFVKRIPGQYILLEKNEKFWLKGYPKADRLIFKIISNPSAQVLALEKGEIDLMGWFVPPSQIKALEEHPAINLTVVDDLGYFFLGFNLRKKPMSDLAFRRAVSAIIDKNAIIEGFLMGFGSPGYTPVPIPLKEWFLEDAKNLTKYPWMDPGKNVTLAKKILADAGWRDTDGNGKFDLMPDGKTSVKGMKIEIMAPSYDPVRVRACMMICTTLEEIFDIDFVPKIPDFNTLIVTVFYTVPPNFDMYILGYSLGIEPILFLMPIFHSRYMPEKVTGGDNAYGFQNSTYDKLCEDALKEYNVTARKEIVFELQRILVEQLPAIILYYRKNVQAYRADKVAGIVPSSIGGHMNYWTFINVYKKTVVPPIPTPPEVIPMISAAVAVSAILSIAAGFWFRRAFVAA